MNALEIIFLILGFLSVSISFFIGNKENKPEAGGQDALTFSKDVWTEKEEQLVREQITRILNEERENIVVETTNALNRRSNEKIMEFDEFSRQLMEKINHNHEEVVFMYNMLTEKEKEWKTGAAKRPAIPQEPEPQPEADSPAVKPQAVVKPKKEKVVKKPPLTALEKLSRKAKTSVVEKKPDEPSVYEAAEQTGLSADVRVDTPENKAFPVQDNGEEAEPARTDDTNARIIKMYKKGMSVTDISKELNVGQGEVKLTIALYGGNR